MVSVGPKTIYPGKLHLVLKTAVQSTINYIMPIQKLMSSTKLPNHWNHLETLYMTEILSITTKNVYLLQSYKKLIKVWHLISK